MTEEERADISPLVGSDHPEFKLSDVRNSVLIPPQMIDKMLAPKEKNLANLSIAAIEEFQERMYESSESRTLFEVDLAVKKAERSSLNKKWQQLANSCGIEVVIYLLNFGRANAIKLVV